MDLSSARPTRIAPTSGATSQRHADRSRVGPLLSTTEASEHGEASSGRILPVEAWEIAALKAGWKCWRAEVLEARQTRLRWGDCAAPHKKEGKLPAKSSAVAHQSGWDRNEWSAVTPRGAAREPNDATSRLEVLPRRKVRTTKSPVTITETSGISQKVNTDACTQVCLIWVPPCHGHLRAGKCYNANLDYTSIHVNSLICKAICYPQPHSLHPGCLYDTWSLIGIGVDIPTYQDGSEKQGGGAYYQCCTCDNLTPQAAVRYFDGSMRLHSPGSPFH